VPKPTSAANIRKISECLDGNLRTLPAQADMQSRSSVKKIRSNVNFGNERRV